MATYPGRHDLIIVDNRVPFGQIIYGQLQLGGMPLTRLVKHNTIEQHYLAWETVRKVRNPFFSNGTGFEGYFVGVVQSPEEALDRILDVNQYILDAITRFYRFEYGFKSRLMKTLTREMSDIETMYVWSSYLGAALARLRRQVDQNRYSTQFREQTYQLLSNLPLMQYQPVENNIHQHFVIKRADDFHSSCIQISEYMLNRKQQDAWLIARNIGEFGHPLIRQFLHEVKDI